MGNVIVAIKPASTSGGASGVTRYIAESKRNAEKEGLAEKEPRPLFSTTEDRLNYLEANEILAAPTGALAEKEDVIHIVISPEKGQFEQLGETLEERLEAFREVVREAAAEIENEVEFVELHWIAGIHLNTEIPHAHLAISRDGWDRPTERAKHIEHLPRTLLPHNVQNEEKEKTFIPGKIAQAISDGIEKQRQLVLQKSIEKELAPKEEILTQTPDHEAPDHENIPQPAEPRNLIPENDRPEPLSQDSTQIDLQIPEPTDPQIVFNPNGHETIEEPDYVLTPDDSHDLTPPPEPPEQPHILIDQSHPEPIVFLSDEHSETVADFHEPPAPAEELLKPPNVSDHTWRDRYILGRSMVARGEIERLETDLKNTREHGDKRRFRVYDATHGHTRPISAFDIQRRAEAAAGAATRQAQTVDPDQRHQIRQARYDMEIERHEKGIHDHRIIVAKTITKIEKNLDAAYRQHSELRPEVQRIQLNYNHIQQPLPIPLLRPSEINKLQDQAIAARNPSRVHTLETIREHLATERGDRTRSDQDLAHVDGQLLVARSEHAARNERAQQFERTRHQTRWEIDDQKYSLTDLDRRISEQENRSRLFGSPLKITTLHLRPSSRQEARLQVAHLRDVREQVVTSIEERRQELNAATKEAGRMTAILSEIHVKEQDRQLARNGERQEKILTRSELNQLIDHANTLADPAMLKQALMLETRFEERLAPSKQPTARQGAARAAGREVLTDIALRQATERLEGFKERKPFVPVAIRDRQGQEQTARLFDFRHQRHPLVWLAVRLTESKDQRHLRRETNKAIDTEHARLKEELVKATQCHELTKEISATHREELSISQQPLPDAAFTPKQIVQLEIYATRHQDPLERLRVETIVHRAEIAAQTHSTHATQPTPELQIPGEHLRHADQQFYQTSGDHNPASSKHDSFTPEQDCSSSASHLPQHVQPTNPQTNPAEPAKDGPDLDITL
jgi:hypothetical protein